MAVKIVSAYIDLNAVRAGLCEDPKDYRFCGYAEAVAGAVRAREGLQLVTEAEDWRGAGRSYRVLLFGQADNMRHPDSRPLIDPEEVKKVLASGGKLSVTELLHCRVRYFADGAVFGSREYVQRCFERFRENFGEHRKTGPRSMRGGEWAGLTVLRDLRKEVFG